MLSFRQFIASPFVQSQRLGSVLASESDNELLERSRELQYRAQSGEDRRTYLPEALALVREAATRTVEQTPFDVQMHGALGLCNEAIIEMQTGEGKTLTATLALYLFALEGNGAHLATSNDYLAQRDAEAMRPLFEFLGLSVGVVTESQNDLQRKSAYSCDITYGTLMQFGFDFLRDRIKHQSAPDSFAVDDQRVMRDLFFLLVDEADALLIDEANTPLVIGAPTFISPNDEATFYWAAEVAREAIADQHFTIRLQDRSIQLTRDGRSWCREQASASDISYTSTLQLYERLERAILVHLYFQKNTHYVVRDAEITLVSNTTGRLGEGRQWQDGIHQAIQALEFLPITSPPAQAAKITVQGLVLSYDHFAGMTGTALAAASELKKVYRKSVKKIPPRLRSQKQHLPPHFSLSEADKWRAIVTEVAEFHRAGRPVLIGTRSIEKSRKLSRLLDAQNLGHQVLNAVEHHRESQIISRAGRAGEITVATDMAGRGTDIVLTDEAERAGGLHVILSEYHDSPRQDEQLFGRCGRQGQPGSCRQFLSLDDEILSLGYGDDRAAEIRHKSRNNADVLRAAQLELETRKRKNRIATLYHERRRLRALQEMGRDPLLDDV